MDPRALKPIRGRGPKPKYGTKSVVRSIRTPEKLWDQLEELAKANGMTRNELVVRTMQRKVKRDL